MVPAATTAVVEILIEKTAPEVTAPAPSDGAEGTASALPAAATLSAAAALPAASASPSSPEPLYYVLELPEVDAETSASMALDLSGQLRLVA